MAKYQFNRAVRIAPRPGSKLKPQVYAAGSVHEISHHEIVNHPHFKKFQKAGAITAYVAKAPPKALKPGTQSARNPSAVDGRVKMANEATPTGGVKSSPTKATAAAPETEVGGDADESDETDETSDDADDSSDSKPSKSGKSKKGGRGR